MAKKKTEELAKTALLKPDVLTDKFKFTKHQIEALEKVSLELKVTSDETLVIAENNATSAVKLYKEVEELRKSLKAPYVATSQMIDAYCGIITDNISRIKLRLLTEVTNYRVLKEAQKKAEADSKLQEIADLEKEKTEEADRLVRIEAQLIARIYGGVYTKRDGTPQTLQGCLKSTECSALRIWINDNVPKLETFKHFRNKYEDMLLSIHKKLTEHEANLIDLEKPDYPTATEGAIRRITEARNEATEGVQTTQAEVTKIITKEIKSETKSVENEISEAGKGIRERVVYKVTEAKLIPRDFLSIDPVKINNYLNDNKDKIKEQIANNQEVIPGIKFFIESKFVAR